MDKDSDIEEINKKFKNLNNDSSPICKIFLIKKYFNILNFSKRIVIIRSKSFLLY